MRRGVFIALLKQKRKEEEKRRRSFGWINYLYAIAFNREKYNREKKDFIRLN